MKPTWTTLVFCALALGTTSPAVADPTKAQCIGANEDGQDLRRVGKLRDARARFNACTVPSCPGPLRADCIRQVDELRTLIPKILFVVKDERGNPLRDVEVTMDGSPFLSRLDGLPVDVDPGVHNFRFNAEGYTGFGKGLHVKEASRGEETITLVPIDRIAGRSGRPDGESDAPTVLGIAPRIQRPLGYGVGAAGAVGAVVGVALGVLAKVTYDDALSECTNRNPLTCSRAGVDGSKSAEAQGTASTIAFVAGAVLLAGAAVLLLTLPKRDVSATNGLLRGLTPRIDQQGIRW